MSKNSIKEYILDNAGKFLLLLHKGHSPQRVISLMGFKVNKQTADKYYKTITLNMNRVSVEQKFKDDSKPTFYSSFRDFYKFTPVEKYEIIKESKINFDK